MQQPNDRHLGLLELFILKQLTQHIKRHHGLDLTLHGLVPALGHIGNQVQVLHEIAPGRGVLLLTDLIVVREPTLLGDILVDGGLGVDDVVLLGETHLVDYAVFL